MKKLFLRFKSKTTAGCQGFLLVDLLIAMVVMVVGLMGLAMLLGIAVQTNALSKNTSEAVILAQSKLEEFKTRNTNGNLQLQPGGSLEANTTNHYDRPNNNYTRRWSVADGPGQSREVTVRVVPQASNLQNKTIELKTILRLR